jgi:iron complex transport system substrate-binding protein
VILRRPLQAIPFCLLLTALSAAAAAGQVRVTDDLQHTTTLPVPARRIVSLAPSLTEALFAIGAGDRVVGVTEYCTEPPEARTRPRVGGMINPSIEAIVGLRPDLIVVSMEGNTRADFERLTDLGMPVFASNPRTLEGIRRSLAQLGELTGCAAGATALAGRLKAREDSLRAAIPASRPGVVLALSLQPLIVVGAHTYLSELLALAGADNVGDRAPGTYPTISRESLAAADPEVILVMSDIGASPADALRLFPEWRTLRAARTGKIFTVNADLLSRPGPRAVDGLAHLIHVIHFGRP